MVRNLPANAEVPYRTLGQEDLLRRKWQPPSSILNGKMQWHAPVHGGHKDSETPEQLSLHSEVNTDIKTL